MFLSQLILLLAFSQTVYGLLGKMKNATVTGELNCGRNYYADVKVELWEADTCQFRYFDTKFAYSYCISKSLLLARSRNLTTSPEF